MAAGAELVAAELTSVDEAGSRDGVRQERVSNGLENLVKANAFVHFLQTGVFLSVLCLRASFLRFTRRRRHVPLITCYV